MDGHLGLGAESKDICVPCQCLNKKHSLKRRLSGITWTAIPTQNMESQQSFLASFRDLVSCWKLSKWTDVRILLHRPDTEITTLDCKFKSNEIVLQMLSGLGGSPCSHGRLVQTGTTHQTRVIKANFLKKNYIQYYQIPTSVQFPNLPFKGKKELRKDSW